jgi:hypothetical protein
MSLSNAYVLAPGKFLHVRQMLLGSILGPSYLTLPKQQTTDRPKRKSRKKGINLGLANGCSGGDYTSDTLGSAPPYGLSLRSTKIKRKHASFLQKCQ